MMAGEGRERIHLYDTTLRDGAQTTGVDFSLADKLAVMKMLDRLGVDFIEGGYPGANPLDTQLFAEKRALRAKFACFGMTKRAGVSASNDPGVAALLQAEADVVCYVAKAWDFHVRTALGCTLAENLDGLKESVEAALARGREAIVDCEHFFDGYKANPAYALDVARAAHAAGAGWVVLCDTNGGTLPDEVERIVGAVMTAVPGIRLGIHAHDDTGHAIANSLAAVRAGARQIQGTLNGLGERCGNANLVSLIPTLKLKEPYASRFEIGVSDAAMAGLTQLSRAFDELLNRQPNRQAPYVGASAFATKAGIHASAVLKDPRTYEHVEPARVGNSRAVLVSTQAGRSNVLAELERLGINAPRNDPRIARLLEEVKDREAVGYAYEGADASFYVLAQRVLGRAREYFRVERFQGERGAALQRQRPARDLLRGDGEGEHRRRDDDFRRRGRRPGQRAGSGAAQGSRQVPEADRGNQPRRLQGAHFPGRHRRGHARAGRKPRRDRRELDHRRRVGEHHRRLVPGADGFDHLQADAGEEG